MYIKNPGLGCRQNPHPMAVPVSLNKYIRFYLDCVRPLLANQSGKAFWVNSKGEPLSSESCRLYIRTFLSQIIGKDLTIRLLRLNLNALHHDEGPHDPQDQLWFDYCMDHTAATRQAYYIIWNTEAWAHKAAEKPHPFVVISLSFTLIDLF